MDWGAGRCDDAKGDRDESDEEGRSGGLGYVDERFEGEKMRGCEG